MAAESEPRPAHAAPVSTARMALLLGALSMFGPFAIDTLFPAFPQLARDLSASPMAMQQTISAYLVAYALVCVLHGPMSDAWGRRPVILVGVAVFGVASVGCALSTTLGELLTWRALQGMSAGVGLIVGRAIIRDCFEGDAAHRLMAAVTMIFSIAPALAPIIGGWIIAFAPWPAIFWFLVVFSVLLWTACMIWLPETHPAALRTPLRPAPLFALKRAMLGNGRFVRLALAGGFNFAALFTYIASAPAFVLDILRLNAQQFAWFFVPAIAGMSFGAFVSGRLAGRIAPGAAVRLGFAICALAALANLGYNAFVEEPRVPWAVLPMALNAIGIALVFPLLALALLDMYPRQRGTASSMQMVLGLGVNTLVAGVVSPLVSHDPKLLAATAACMTAVGWVLWRVDASQMPRTMPAA